MRGKRNITAHTKRGNDSFKVEEVYPKRTVTSKKRCSGGNDQDKSTGISTLIQVVPLILPLFHTISVRMPSDV